MKKAFIISLMDDLIQQLELVERKTDVLFRRSITRGDGLLSPDEAAEILDISQQELLAHMESGQIEFEGKGEILGFDLNHLKDFINDYEQSQSHEEGGLSDDG